MCWRKDSLFNKCCWENYIYACRKLELDPSLSPCTSINSKQIKDLNIRPETLKLVQERVGNTLEAIRKGNNYLSTTQLAQQLRKKVNKWDYMQLKTSKLKRMPTVWGKNLCHLYIRYILITRMYREFKKLNSPKSNDSIKQWTNELNTESSQRKKSKWLKIT
jgi:hypothetical protein